jgi:hypothetical protein
VPGTRVASVQPARVPVSSKTLAPAIVALARAWTKGGPAAGLLGVVARTRLALWSRTPARSRRAARPGSWHLASVAQSREALSTALLVLVVPVMALAAALMLAG